MGKACRTGQAGMLQGHHHDVTNLYTPNLLAAKRNPRIKSYTGAPGNMYFLHYYSVSAIRKTIETSRSSSQKVKSRFAKLANCFAFNILTRTQGLIQARPGSLGRVPLYQQDTKKPPSEKKGGIRESRMYSTVLAGPYLYHPDRQTRQKRVAP